MPAEAKVFSDRSCVIGGAVGFFVMNPTFSLNTLILHKNWSLTVGVVVVSRKFAFTATCCRHSTYADDLLAKLCLTLDFFFFFFRYFIFHFLLQLFVVTFLRINVSYMFLSYLRSVIQSHMWNLSLGVSVLHQHAET